MIELFDPDGLPTVDLYAPVAVTDRARLVFVAGQVAVDAAGAVVGPGDLAAQVERCYLNVATALEAAGASFADLVKLTAYVVDWSPDKMAALADGIGRATGRLGVVHRPPFTGLGVAALAAPELLVEVEAIAALP